MVYLIFVNSHTDGSHLQVVVYNTCWYRAESKILCTVLGHSKGTYCSCSAFLQSAIIWYQDHGATSCFWGQIFVNIYWFSESWNDLLVISATLWWWIEKYLQYSYNQTFSDVNASQACIKELGKDEGILLIRHNKIYLCQQLAALPGLKLQLFQFPQFFAYSFAHV